jgi:hypothetical protein
VQSFTKARAEVAGSYEAVMRRLTAIEAAASDAPPAKRVDTQPTVKR